ncbi:MAG: hypothetical protein GXO43_04520 [Crenarchaeota archaeon]|nr:hypothetical protein [Thermoproteota archaeon]
MDPNKRLLIGIIIVITIVIGGLAYTIYNYAQTPQAMSTTMTTTTPYTQTSIEQTTQTTQSSTTTDYTTTGSPNTTTGLSPYMPTVIPSWKDVTAFMKYLHTKELQGYDVYLAEYMVLSAIYHYKMGNKNTALQLLKQAYKTVKETYRIGSVKLPQIKISDNALEYRRSPTTWDIAPIGTVFLISRYGYLVYPSGDNHWKLSCFIFMAMDNNGSFIYQGRLPLLPRETQWMRFYPKIYYDREWHHLWKIRFVGPIFVEKGDGWIKLCTCIAGFTNNLNFMIDTSNNPSPLKNIPMDHQMGINLSYEHMIIDTTNFTVTLKRSLQLAMISLILQK